MTEILTSPEFWAGTTAFVAAVGSAVVFKRRKRVKNKRKKK